MNIFPSSIFCDYSYLDYYKFTENFIFKDIGISKRILDIGCRNGLFTEKIFKNTHAKEIIGVDNSSEVIQVATLNNKIEKIKYYCEDGENFQYLKNLGTFDIIHIRNTFHHFNKPKQFLENITYLLNKNGKIIIIDVDHESFKMNFGRVSIGEMLTWISIFKMIGLSKGVKAIKDTAFWSSEYRKHHYEDIKRQEKIGWFKNKEINKQLGTIFMYYSFHRIGGLFGLGGVYYFVFKKL